MTAGGRTAGLLPIARGDVFDNDKGGKFAPGRLLCVSDNVCSKALCLGHCSTLGTYIPGRRDHCNAGCHCRSSGHLFAFVRSPELHMAGIVQTLLTKQLSGPSSRQAVTKTPARYI